MNDKSAKEVLLESMFSALIDTLQAMKDNSSSPNILLREIMAIHPNATYDALPAAVKKSMEESVFASFRRFQKEGYILTSSKPVQPRKPAANVGRVVGRGQTR